ncbi:MAG: hypothetical protein K0U63_02965 [Cyanobacteria bacterium]|nr:hypothetical protein [Cyanobacteriota bacterium]
MTGPDTSPGPLSRLEAERLEATLLPNLERHHLRLLAHGLRSFQAMAGSQEGALPATSQLDHWLAQQTGPAADAAFRSSFRRELISLGKQLEEIASGLQCTPLALSLDQLIAWATAEADQRHQ